MTMTCICTRPICAGPGVIASTYLYWSQIRAERTAAGRPFRARRGDFEPASTLYLLGGLLDGDAPVRLRLAFAAEEFGLTPKRLEAELAWLDRHRFVYLDGSVDGIARIWVNPAA
ncbi:hypothetical protein ACIRN5_23365, partial [Lysinibacillus fusiformis]|uniref:hypothetical protein n=2 Tax=Bacillati TaxID=1783272 RepID=UPI003821AB86